MAVHHFVDPSREVVITTCSGQVTFEDAITSCNGLRRNPDFRPDFRQIGDLSHISDFRLDAGSVREIYRNDPFSNQSKRAIVTPTSGLVFQFARLYQSLVSNSKFEIFQTIPEALAWLALEITLIEPVNCEDIAPNLRTATGEPVMIDLPAEVPRTFRGFRDAAQAKAARRS